MLFGHNSNVIVGADTIHVQTEDRGTIHAVIDTTVHWKGRVLHRRTSNYRDLLPFDAGKETALRDRIAEQHRAVIDEIRSGSLQLKLTADIPVRNAVPEPQPAMPTALKIEIVNPKSWLVGKSASLRTLVRDAMANPVSGAEVRSRIEGGVAAAESAARTGADGSAELRFEMPGLAAAEAALVVEAVAGAAKGQLRFQLRAKAKG